MLGWQSSGHGSSLVPRGGNGALYQLERISLCSDSAVRSHKHAGPLSTQRSLLRPENQEPQALHSQPNVRGVTNSCMWSGWRRFSPRLCRSCSRTRGLTCHGGCSVDSRWGCAPQTGAVTCCVAADKSQNTSDCRLFMHELKQHVPQMTTEKKCSNRCESTWSAVELPHEYEILRYNVNLCYRPKW